MKHTLLSMGIAVFLLTFSFACKKHTEDILSGTWEVVNVEDIYAPHTDEWEFNDGALTMYRRSKANTSDAVIHDSGVYLFESTPIKSTIRLFDTSNEIWNGNWNVVKLNDENMVIQLDIVGGVLYKEFVKIR